MLASALGGYLNINPAGEVRSRGSTVEFGIPVSRSELAEKFCADVRLMRESGTSSNDISSS